ncbi:FAD-binding oxidoreductase [Pleionea sediminis]|uniref:FAD-binding oxidoreductase n=1 Tax=Pleionea sediminis TaxID=2569479 RepID=UPI001186E614|nr:FAD-binding oxidoreductase [Pleionea sediminis]
MSKASIEQLNEILGKDQVITDPDSLEQYGQDWSKLFTPNAMAVLRPNSIEQVQDIIRWAKEHKVAIVPSGGRTGLSGGAYATQGEVVLSLDRMNQIQSFNAVDQTVVCGAGVITEQLQNFAEENDLYYPVDFASTGSSQIGGNIATNAGGIKVIRWGMTRDWVAGLKVVTGNGDLLDLNQGLVKNATGYDFRHLMIGSEGTLGIIVEATMKLTRKPKELTVMVLGLNTLKDVYPVMEQFQKSLSLTAFEFFSEQALQHVLSHHDLQRPFDSESDFYVLIEFENDSEATTDLAFGAFEKVMEQGLIVDGVISQSETQAEQLWGLRERISESISVRTPYKNDISVVPSKVADFLSAVDGIVKEKYPSFEIIWFGHIGDGNLHLNILKPEDLAVDEFVAQCKQVNPLIFDAIQSLGGSISAEHGVGLVKKDYLPYSRSEIEITLMKQIKKAFDPAGILNPGKLIDCSE